MVRRLVLSTLGIVKVLLWVFACLWTLMIGGLLTVILIVYAGFEGNANLPADCGIVFGAAVYGRSLPGPAIVRRVEKAVLLYREGSVGTVILSGGTGEGNRQSEAQVMLTQALQRGIAREDIVLEQASRSTWENIANSRVLAEECESVVAISDRYHLARIELIADRLGWEELDTVPADGRAEVAAERRSLLREAVAYVYYALRLDYLIPIRESLE